MTRTARNWTQRIFEPGTTFLIRDQVAQDPNFQISNNRRAAAYAGDVGGSMIVAPLLASTAMQIGGGLYNTAAPEALDIPAESLANLAALGAMGYGIHRGITRFHNAGRWPGFMGKFADQATIATPGPKPGPDAEPMPVTGPGPQGPVPGGTPPIYPRSIIIEDGNPSVPPMSAMLPPLQGLDAPPPFVKMPDPSPRLDAPPPFPRVDTPPPFVEMPPPFPQIDPPPFVEMPPPFPRVDTPPPFVGVVVAPSSARKTVRDAEPVVVDVPVQQVPPASAMDPQKVAALAAALEADRKRQAQITLTSLNEDPYGFDITF